MWPFLFATGCVCLSILQVALALSDGEEHSLRQLFDTCENPPSLDSICSPQAGIICDANKQHLVKLQFDFDAGIKTNERKPFRCNVSKWSSEKIDMKSFSYLTSLVFRKQGMYGQLPASLCELPSLSRLDLSWNELTGGLHSLFDKGDLPRNMRLLDLSHNQLTGNIPARLAELPLRTLRLQHNKLTSRIPDSILSSADLVMVSMSNNKLTGPVPTVGSTMRLLDLASNRLSGVLPQTLPGLLQQLSLDKNRFNGSIPTSYKSLASLKTLELNNNQLTGLVPEFSSLLDVNFVDNKFMCPLPTGLVDSDRASCICHKGSRGDRSSCELCPLGLYNPDTGTDAKWVKECKECKKGTYTPTAGAASCIKSPEVITTTAAVLLVVDDSEDTARLILFVMIPLLLLIVVSLSVIWGILLRVDDDELIQKQKMRKVLSKLSRRVAKGEFTTPQAYHIFASWKKSYLESPKGTNSMFFWLKVEFHVNKVLEHPELYQKTPPREDWDSIWDNLDALGEEKFDVADDVNYEGKQPRKWKSVPNSKIELPEGVSMDQL